MFSQNLNLMLYVTDVAVEKNFWKAIGFTITSEEKIMDYDTFQMKSHPQSSLTISVFSKAFIQEMSPEVETHEPSLLLETSQLDQLHHHISSVSDYTVNAIADVPFRHFNFETPSGLFIAVKEA